MGSTNHGAQDITYTYFENATAEDFNKRNLNIRPRGIYSGGYLTRVSDVEVTLSTLAAEIGDDDEQISVQTAAAATLNVSTLDSGSIAEATPYLLLRWNFLAQKDNYVEVHAVASLASALDNDIVVGKCSFSGATLSSFDYSERTFFPDENLFLRVEESTLNYVWLRAGRIQNGAQSIFVKEQRVGPFTLPASPNNRIDLVYISNAGTPTILQGTAAVSPSAPNYGGKLVVAEVTVTNGVTAIPADSIKDVRSFIFQPAIPDDVTLELNSSGKLATKSSLAFGTSTFLDSLGGTLVITSVYKAAVDGFLLVVMAGGSDARIYVGSANPPTITFARHTWSDSSTYSPMMVPVPKNNYVQVTGTISSVPSIIWQPIGSGSLVKQ